VIVRAAFAPPVTNKPPANNKKTDRKRFTQTSAEKLRDNPGMLSNHFSETLQKPNAEQRFSRLPSPNSISNGHPDWDGARATEQVKKILALKISCEKTAPPPTWPCYTPKVARSKQPIQNLINQP